MAMACVRIHCGCGRSHVFPMGSHARCACGAQWNIGKPGSRPLALPGGVTPAAVTSLPPAPEPAGPPPRVNGKVLGFRCWQLSGYDLLSTNVPNAKWKIGVNQAECLRMGFYSLVMPAGAQPPDHHAHDAPAHDCHCGLYAYHEPAWTPSYTSEAIWGAVLAWGRMEVYARGFRAQYAEPVVLAYSPQQPYETVKRAEAIAGEMDVPFVALDELQAEAGTHGQPVTKELRPSMEGMGLASGGLVPMSPYHLTYTGPLDAPTRRRSRTTKLLAAINFFGAGANLGFFAAELHPWNLAAALVGLVVGCLIWRQG